MSKKLTKAQAAARDEQMGYLIEALRNATRYDRRDGTWAVKVYATVAHVAPSGMSRVFKMWTIDRTDSDLVGISWKIALVNGYTWSDKHSGFNIGGCGMDMGFHALDTLARNLPAAVREELGLKNGNDFDLRYI